MMGRTTTAPLPAGWTECRLVELVDVLDHKRVPVSTKERDERHGDVPYYGATQQVGWIDDYLFDEPLVLVSEDGSHFLTDGATKAYMVDGKSWVNNHAHVLRANEAVVDRRYLTYFLNQLNFSPYINGTTRQKLTKSALANIRVPLAPRAEQTAIVEVLDRTLSLVQNGLDSFERALGAVEAYRSTTLRSILSGELPTLASGVASALAGAERRALTELADIKYGYTAKASDEPVGPRMLRITDIQDGLVDWPAVPYCAIEDDERPAYLLRTGDIVFARMGFTTGKSYLIGADVPEAVYASYLIRVRPTTEVRPEFLALFFQSSDYWAYVQSKRQGIDRPTINGKVLGSMLVPVPALWAQDAAVAQAHRHLGAVGDMRTTLSAKLEDGRSLRSSLLYQAFTGGLASVTVSTRDPKTARAVLAAE